MKTNRLLLNCIKFCKSEGIYHFVRNLDLIVCVNGKFVTFRFGEANEKQDKKLVVSGGQIFRPPTLQEFVDTVRSIQGD